MKKYSIIPVRFLILVILINIPILAVQYTIIQEDENKISFTATDSAKFEWRHTDRYPGNHSSFNLGVADLVEISDRLSIPFWTFPLVLPSADRPQVEISGIVTQEITLQKALTRDDIQAINSKPIYDISDIGFYRFSPAGDLVIYPVRVISSDKIQLIRSFNVTVNYMRKRTYQKSVVPIKTQNSEYPFINKKFLQQWEIRPEKSLAKQVTYPTGQWFKVTVKENGIYKISYHDLLIEGLSDEPLDINRIYLYSNATGGREISGISGIDVLENLVENARKIESSQTGLLGNGDNILFYGRSSSGVDSDASGQLNFSRNSYSDVNYYWLLIADEPGSPKSIISKESLSTAADFTVTSTEKIDRHELELSNFLRSGKDWYGEKFNGSGSSVSVIFQIPEPGDEYPVAYTYPVKMSWKTRGANNETVHNFKLYLNSEPDPVYSWSSSEWYVSSKTLNTSLKPGYNIVKISYNSSNSSGEAFLDYFEFQYEAPLKPREAELDFWGPAEIGNVEYRISDIDFTDPIIYDITDWANVAIQKLGVVGNDNLRFQMESTLTDRAHYLITRSARVRVPEQIAKIDNPQWNTIRRNDLSAQYIIITNEKFQTAAQDLAHLHSQEVREKDRLSTLVVLQSQILREFNADVIDPHAIRQFLTYALNNWTIPPEFVLLLGDGTFDYRHIESEAGDLIMTYQVESTTGYSGFNSYATDMRFTYVNGPDNKMDLAIGRINARTADEAQAAVDKIRSYILDPIYGDWRNTITLIADDPVRPQKDEQEHILDTENKIANYLPKTINLKKLYLLEYPEVQDATSYGVRKPDATIALLKQIEDGTVLINYFGHGSPTVWAQEYILEMNRDLGLINTGMKLPFWIAGTCSWGQFDDISGSCFPEALVLESDDGGIAALAATRATYGIHNASFVNSWITNLFNDKTANRIRIGQVLQNISSVGSGININNEKYVLFGDPALYLALPYNSVEFESLQSDTLKTLSNIRVSGTVDNIITAYDGVGILKLYDSERRVTRNYINGYNKENSLSYILPGEVLYSGLVNISKGQFSSKFYIPKDLNYAGLGGKITITGWNEETDIEVGGFYNPVFFAGSESVIDTTGPDIEIGFVDLNFKNGDVVTPENQIEVTIHDPIGINIAGKMGHDISVTFDDNLDETYIITEYFTYNTDSDSSGIVIFPMPNLDAGDHQFSVTAWDNGNNSTTENCTFSLLSDSDFSLERVVNFPNPFSTTTDITFVVTHPASIECSIYTVRGLKIRTLDTEQLFLPGFNTINWDGEDDFGDRVAKGIYIYKMKATSSESQTRARFIGKMVKAG